ncbi:MAG: hypothetical protein ACXWNE_03845 [Candidatus Binataceae bacterium]
MIREAQRSSSDRKRMTMIRRRDGHAWAFIKGAPEVIIERCSKIKGADGDEPLSADDRAGMLEASAAIPWASSRQACSRRESSSAARCVPCGSNDGFDGRLQLQNKPEIEAAYARRSSATGPYSQNRLPPRL